MLQAAFHQSHHFRFRRLFAMLRRMPEAAAALYFTDSRGECYCVYDVAFGPPLAPLGRRKQLALGDPRARYRLFVSANPTAMVRMHDFGRDGGDRTLTAENLSAQLSRQLLAEAL